MEKKTASSSDGRDLFQFHRLNRTTPMSTLSIIIAPVTAMP